jgi:hypothetical protein
VRSAECGVKGAAGANEKLDSGLLEPAFGLAGLELELGDRFDGVAGNGDVAVPGGKLEGGVDGAGEGAAGFEIEPGADGLDGAGEEGVVLDVGFGDLEAGFEGEELG